MDLRYNKIKKGGGDVGKKNKFKKHNRKKNNPNIQRKKRFWLTDVPIVACICLIVMGAALLGGIAMTWHVDKMIEKEDAIPLTATYRFYTIVTSPKGSVNGADIFFFDHDEIKINGASFHAGVEDSLDRLQSGEQVEMLLHPNSGEIWQMTSGDEMILRFEDAKKDIFNGNIAISVLLAVFGGLSIAMGAGSLVMQIVQRHKDQKNKVKG